jgi:hypothetical protein
MLRRTLIVVFLVALAVPVVASPCWACSCATSGNAAQDRRDQAERADLVFTGVAKSQRVTDEGDPEFEGDEMIGTRFRVGKTYKGHPGRWVTVATYANGATCGYHFEVGKRYTVFADEQNGEYSTGLCSGTKQGRINPERYGFED